MPSPSCPKCTGAMVAGFLPYESYGTRKPAAWVEGEPVRSIWTGLKLRGKRQLPIRSLRCARCGFLELYAPDA